MPSKQNDDNARLCSFTRRISGRHSEYPYLSVLSPVHICPECMFVFTVACMVVAIGDF